MAARLSAFWDLSPVVHGFGESRSNTMRMTLSGSESRLWFGITGLAERGNGTRSRSGQQQTGEHRGDAAADGVH